MTPMSQVCSCRTLFCAMMLALLCTTSCSRPAGVPAADAVPADQASFRDHPTDPREPASSDAARAAGPAENVLPFQDSQTLPAGTLLTVRLKNPVTAGEAAKDVSFEAEMDEAVVVEGNTLIPMGAPVAGRVQAARISQVKPNRAYIRLALESVHVGGLDVPVQTASLFTRQTPQSDSVIRLEKGRRLTFRLSEPTYLGTQRALAGR